MSSNIICPLCNRQMILGVRLTNWELPESTRITISSQDTDSKEVQKKLSTFIRNPSYSSAEVFNFIETEKTEKHGVVHRTCYLTHYLEIINVETLDFKIQTDSKNLSIVLLINRKTPRELWGAISEFHFDPRAFQLSLTRTGRENIFTCSCGDSGCDGWYGLLVEKEKNKIMWLIEDRLGKPTKLVYEEKIYLDFYYRLYRELKNLVEKEKMGNYSLFPGVSLDFLVRTLKSRNSN